MCAVPYLEQAQTSGFVCSQSLIKHIKVYMQDEHIHEKLILSKL